jgi:uncharacterized protein (TIGR02452 family)
LKIQQQGFYVAPNGARIDISETQKRSEVESYALTPEQGEKLIRELISTDDVANTVYRVVNRSTVQAIIEAADSGKRVAALNFASAKNPGGGFLSGAVAQEEALAISSGLYNTLIRHEDSFYKTNRECRSTMYTDYAIYSPDVVFFRAPDFRLLDRPVSSSVLTSPAVNMKQVREKGEDVSQAKAVMKNRMRLCLAILAKEKNDVVILGAYGCGVFGNDSVEVARWWRELLVEEKYEAHFSEVVFAVLDKTNGEAISAFEREFGRR